MPLIIVTGLPCTGKSRFSQDLKVFLESKECSVVMVNEESEKVDKSSGYANATEEKVTRGVLKGAIDHALSDKTYVIADSLNYIKGFRYELYCMARTCKTQHCCIYVHCDENVSDSWRSSRKELTGECYNDEIFADLRRRYEMPNERNRWDCPMFRVDTTPLDIRKANLDKKSAQLSSADTNASVEAPVKVSSFRRKGSSSGTSVASTAVSSFKKAPKSNIKDPLVFNRLDERAVVGGGESLQAVSGEAPTAEETMRNIHVFFESAGDVAVTPHSSTVKAATGGANLLDELEIVCSDIVALVGAHQLSDDQGLGAPLLLKTYDRKMILPRIVSPAELHRLKTQFVNYKRHHPPSDSLSGGSDFIDFIANQLDS